MPISFGEQRVLRRIDEAVCRSDPRLAPMLATFARLTAAEAMPERERLRTLARRVRAVLLLPIIAIARPITWPANVRNPAGHDPRPDSAAMRSRAANRPSLYRRSTGPRTGQQPAKPGPSHP